MMENYFAQLNAVNVNGKTEKKGSLTYLSWAWAWGEVKKLHPEATYTIYENAQGWNYHTDGHTAWVKTGVTVCGIEHVEYLPVMDYNNRSILLEKVTSFDVNKAIQRSLTKALARHGLGLYIYAGEDLPEAEKPPVEPQPPGEDDEAALKPGSRMPPEGDAPVVCDGCGLRISDYWDGKELIKAAELGARSHEKYGKTLCRKCGKAEDKRQEAEGA